MMRRALWLGVIFLTASNSGFAQETLLLKDGDRVVLLGNGFIGGEREHGYLEARWSRHVPQANVVFRNLGWPGDNVLGAARTGGFQNPGGIDRLVKEVRELKPTVLVIGYGMNESFDGSDALPAFVKGYKQLLAKLAMPGAKIILLSPSRHEDLGRPWIDPTEHNAQLEKYTAALEDIAGTEQLRFVDVFHPLRDIFQKAKSRFTTNGIQLNDAGYRQLAKIVESKLGLPSYPESLDIDTTGKSTAARGRTIEVLEAGDLPRVRVREDMVPIPDDSLFLRVQGLKPGDYGVRIEGATVLQATATELATGVRIAAGGPFKRGADLCQKIVGKNEFFYHRWRPFNDHSRHWGFIGKDFALWEQQVGQQEQVIAQGRRPVAYMIEILRAEKP